MVSNSYQKFKNVPAQRIRDENTFLDMLSDHVADDDYFWFLADSCNTVTQFGAELVRRFPEKAGQIVLATAETKVQVQNASEQFKTKSVYCFRRNC